MQNNCDDDDNDVVYKDIVIVGNGPSGISLSYMLAGNWPYYTGEPHPVDDMLTARLHFTTKPFTNDDDVHGSDETTRNKLDEDACPRRQCNVANDGLTRGRDLAHSSRWKLETLSSGLEGRSGGRPLSLLMDQLQNPCVDAGLDVPSLLHWKSKDQHSEHKIIDHVVLGKGQPGGAWQVFKNFMDPNVLTISLSRWMSLPGLDLRQWEKLVEIEQVQKSTLANGDPCSHSPREKISACKPASRVPVGTVAAYYRDYVTEQGLDKYFRCGTTVTSVRSIDTIGANKDFGWIVEGYENKTGKRFEYRCRRVVLATGTTDLSNHLGIPGERSQSSWVIHDLNDLESRLDQFVSEYGEVALDGLLDPVLVIGAGLSAADAIMAARFRGIPVLHVFRDASNDWNKESSDKIKTNTFDKLQWLPNSIYPEYHKVYEMMADGGTNYPLYKSLPGYTLVDLNINNDDCSSNQCNKHTVTLCTPNGQLKNFRVSIVAILIGYKPDLSYLENNGIGFGKVSDKSIDCKSNPIEVDDITYEVLKSPKKGLYALGPLVGDNFVRFILGGAFGILAHILSTSM
ncbi:oxidative stress-induced growth inhibitor 1-like isoform X1 [Vespa velutina]|uniref:oxidative stress-induced growth inhibitor 1-like isoform X1 n=2 Tax=Vespa velutina TaxID=202808 RepID=UPI001FB2364C|nr:oxidative stress-induced growth inhibitor 1-like isoform X1 [Vespa velutina]XP_047348414.1 oxidative stress-induced growth inhibitor 1-like isoform X1 [Vespa velutina]XP_047348415.1 oxidative stress-induced growth inhibitor 1-like isoform X1 [Vespa velutina]XP_047348416.1 oxidative stress-induced growth inhibitor 1-like isoform X1 [Vespa velutina]